MAIISKDSLKKKIGKSNQPSERVRLAKVDPNYTTGKPHLIFDGEQIVTQKTYPYLSTYTPAADDRVMLVKAGSSWVIIGAIINS